MFTHDEWFHSEKDFKNIDGVFSVEVGVMQTESGSLALEDGKFGVGIIEAHLDDNVEIGDLDELRLAVQRAKWARVMSFSEDKNIEILLSIPEAEDSRSLRSALAPGASSTYRGREFFDRFTGLQVDNAIDAYRVVNSLLQPETYCEFFDEDLAIYPSEFYAGIGDFARNSCADSVSTIITGHLNSVIRTGLGNYCSELNPVGASPDSPSSAPSEEDQAGIEDRNIEHHAQVLESANALAEDVLKVAALQHGSDKTGSSLSASVDGAYQLLTQTYREVGEDQLAESFPDTLAASYLISAKLALSSQNEEFLSTADDYLMASNSLRPDAEANLLLASRSLEASDPKTARSFLNRAIELDRDSGFSFEIARLSRELSALLPPRETITIATVNNGDMIRMQGYVDLFTAETGIGVEWVTLEENVLRQRVTTDITTRGGQFDIMTIGMYETPIWGANGWLVPLDDLSDEYDASDILPAMAGGLSSDGTLYAAPFYGESSMVMYRTDLLEAAGLDMPDAPTWSFIREAAAAMTDRDDEINGICLRGKAGWGEGGAFITAMSNSFGARWFDADWNPQFDTEPWANTLNFFKGMMDESGPPGYASNGFNENLSLFMQGKCGIWIDATVAASFVTNPNDSSVADSVGFALAPNSEGVERRSNWLWAWALAIPAGTLQEDAANQFIEWATSKEYIELVAANEGWANVPPGARTSLYQNPNYAEGPFAKVTLESILSADPNNPTIEPVPYVGIQFAAIPEFAGIATQVSQEFSAAYAGQQTVEEALIKAQAIAEEAMQAAGYR